MTKKLITAVLCAALMLAFVSCGAEKTADEPSGLAADVKAVWDELYEYGELSVAGEGETLSNAFFDWTLNSVRTETSLNGQDAADGKKFVVVNITVTNTEDYEYETGNFEFLCICGTDEGDEVETMNSFYDEMIPDEFNLKAGETVTGDLVFEVNEDVSEVLIDYEEFWSDGSTGSTNWFDLVL